MDERKSVQALTEAGCKESLSIWQDSIARLSLDMVGGRELLGGGRGIGRGIGSAIASWAVVDDRLLLAQGHTSPRTDHKAKQELMHGSC